MDHASWITGATFFEIAVYRRPQYAGQLRNPAIRDDFWEVMFIDRETQGDRYIEAEAYHLGCR